MTETAAPPLSVAIAALTLVPGGMGGTETYLTQLARTLSERDDLSLRAYTASDGAGLDLKIPVHAVSGVVGGATTAQRIRTLAQVMSRRRSLLAGWAHDDVLFFPLTAFTPWPASGRNGPTVVQTLHDVQHLELPHLFSPAERLYRRRWYDAATRRADHVVTDSDFAKRSIVARLGLPPERVTVAHLAVAAADFTPHVGDREPFLLYPARGWAHKNHTRLIEAVTLLREQHPGLRLVLTGGALDALGTVPDWVDVRGLVPRAELADLYRRAACLVFPSLYEGFGIPLLEAMASGCPVAASDAGSIPEVCGDAAELFDPTDPVAIADGVLRALDRADELARLGLARVERFTWAGCADTHVRVFRAVVNRR